MARVAVMNGFHKYLITSSDEIIADVNKFVKEISFKEKFRNFVKH